MKEIILRLIYEAIDEVNETLDDEHKIQKRLDAKICSVGNHLDSLVFVSFIESVENKLEEFYQQEIIVAVDRINQNSYNPFVTIAFFAEFVETLVANRAKVQNY